MLLIPSDTANTYCLQQNFVSWSKIIQVKTKTSKYSLDSTKIYEELVLNTILTKFPG